LPILPFPTLPKNSSIFENNHFLLSKVKDKVKAKFISKLTKDEKKRLSKQLWVPKALVTRVKGPKLNFDFLMHVGELQSQWKTLGA
jgi:hypothetical protein